MHNAPGRTQAGGAHVSTLGLPDQATHYYPCEGIHTKTLVRVPNYMYCIPFLRICMHAMFQAKIQATTAIV